MNDDIEKYIRIAGHEVNVWRVAFYALMVVYGLVVVLTFREYGITSDEPTHERFGKIALQWYLGEVDEGIYTKAHGQKQKPMVESDNAEPVAFYGATKAASTLFCQQFARSNRLPAVVLRIVPIYGYWEGRERLISATILNIHR